MEEPIYSLYEQLNRKINPIVKKLLTSTKVRSKMLSEYGNESFLDPDNKKFPVINPKTGSYDCSLIYAAKVRSKILIAKNNKLKSYYEKILKAAIKLYSDVQCDNALTVENIEGDLRIPLSKIETIYELESSNFDNILDMTNFIEVE